MNNYFSAFSESATQNLDRIAISSSGETITYGQLLTAAEDFAQTLRASGPPRLVPVRRSAGIAWFIEVLGIMAASCAAVPISSAIPSERADFILRDIENPSGLSDDAALIYYTSGSTGAPKGVVLTSEAIKAFSKAHGELFSEEKTVGVAADPSFDAFLLSCFPQLLYGATLHIVPDEVRASLVSLHKFLLRNKIEIIFLSTQLALSYMRAFDNKLLKILLTGGEALRGYVPRSYRVFNLYGPCEATVYVLAHELGEQDALNPADIPIGRQTGANRVMLIEGEICISGPQLASGYLNRPEETARRFVPNPLYDPTRDEPSYRLMYKTGDLAEYDERGALRFRGRADKQVKISGYRIEPGEIEAKIAACAGITAVKVSVLTGKNGEAVLSAVCVGDSDEAKLRRELEKTLPRPMIPTHITFESEIKTDPRTGKGVMS
ncbi:MAG: AMP-binding protein [Oscillospiraceae bacterium]|jgi:non-ribosomal peptide synthetase component F|nr:AMP-binding protein [Oscillospiraceae bacterium]